MNHPTNITDDPLPRLPPRAATSHKGDFGRVLILGGSRNMSGAVALAGKAALRAGAGLVTLAVPRAVQSTVAVHEPSVMTLGLPDDESGQIAAGASAVLGGPLEQATAVCSGPKSAAKADSSCLTNVPLVLVRTPLLSTRRTVSSSSRPMVRPLAR